MNDRLAKLYGYTMFKLTIYIFLVFIPAISISQTEIELSTEFDLDRFAQSLIQENDGLKPPFDSTLRIFYLPNELCSTDTKRDSLFQLIEQLKSIEQGSKLDTAQTFNLLFEVELRSSSSQFIIEEDVNQGFYCINTESKRASGNRLLSPNLRDDSAFNECFQFVYSFNNSFLIIKKNCIHFGDMTNFHAEFVRFYELVPSEKKVEE